MGIPISNPALPKVPAFPEVRVHNGDNYNPPVKVYYPGMTLRDYFAAKAMQGLIASSGGFEYDRQTWCYKVADRMIEARNESGTC